MGTDKSMVTAGLFPALNSQLMGEEPLKLPLSAQQLLCASTWNLIVWLWSPEVLDCGKQTRQWINPSCHQWFWAGQSNWQ